MTDSVSLRDYLAVKAAHSLIVSKEGPDYWIDYPEDTADQAYLMADAMLKAREKKHKLEERARDRAVDHSAEAKEFFWP